jgi:lipoyl synthase
MYGGLNDLKRTRRHPDWLKVSLPGGEQYMDIKRQLRRSKLHTICEEARCPNLSECFGRGTATFLILGDICTRDCRYCHVTHGVPQKVDEKEPQLIAESVQSLGLSYVVITSVTRDDLLDGGASFFSETIRSIRKIVPSCNIEVLIPDFKGNFSDIQVVLDAGPDVLNHNIEVVERLFPLLRPQGEYLRSLSVLKKSKEISKEIPTKSGFMIGLGESMDEIMMLMDDLRKAHVDILTIGQYLQPTSFHAEIQKYYSPREFEQLKTIALDKGFSQVASGPLVRSSYHAEESMKAHKSGTMDL